MQIATSLLLDAPSSGCQHAGLPNGIYQNPLLTSVSPSSNKHISQVTQITTALASLYHPSVKPFSLQSIHPLHVMSAGGVYINENYSEPMAPQHNFANNFDLEDPNQAMSVYARYDLIPLHSDRLLY